MKARISRLVGATMLTGFCAVFISLSANATLLKLSFAGEITHHAYDDDGSYIEGDTFSGNIVFDQNMAPYPNGISTDGVTQYWSNIVSFEYISGTIDVATEPHAPFTGGNYELTTFNGSGRVSYYFYGSNGATITLEGAVSPAASIDNLDTFNLSAFELKLSMLQFGNIIGGPITSAQLTAINSDVPEPASWTMVIGGFGLIGATMRRKRAAVIFA